MNQLRQAQVATAPNGLTRASLSGLSQLNTHEHKSQFHNQGNTPGFVSKVNDTLYQSQQVDQLDCSLKVCLKVWRKGHTTCASGCQQLLGHLLCSRNQRKPRTVQLFPPLPTEIHTLLWGGNEKAEKTVETLTVMMGTHCKTSSIPFTPQFIPQSFPRAQELA